MNLIILTKNLKRMMMTKRFHKCDKCCKCKEEHIDDVYDE
jgi:hypothetical protein